MLQNKSISSKTFKQWQTSTQGEVQPAFERIHKETPLLFTPERYKAFLRFLSLFHNYSYLNLILIFSQYPNATYLAGFNTWKNIATKIKPGSLILKEEHFNNKITILVPFIKETFSEDMKTRIKSEVTYSTVGLYDVAQTNNLPPEPMEELPIDLIKLSMRDIIYSITGCGVYELSQAENNQYLLNDQNACIRELSSKKAIFLRNGLSIDEQQAALISTVVDLTIKEQGIEEDSLGLLIKESSVYALLTHFKLDVSRYTFSYISSYSTHSLHELENILHTVQYIVHNTIIKIEASYEENIASNETNESDLEGLIY